MKDALRGLIYFWSWNCSIFGGYFLFVALKWLQLISTRLHRRMLDYVVTFWQYYVTTLLFRENCKIHVTGDAIRSDEISLIISNHRTRVDWNFLWPIMFHAVEGKNCWWYSTKFILKNSIKHIPGAGWVMQMTKYIFINRNWEEDRYRLDSYIEYVQDMAYKHLLILFPEGTDFTPETKASSDRFAKANNLPEYHNVLHPRSTGFVYLVDQMRQKNCLDAVYDLTLIYPDNCPQNEEQLFFRGKFPKRVIAHIVRHPIDSLPESQTGLKQFLENCWKEKENNITDFRRTGQYPLPGNLLLKNQYLTLPRAYAMHVIWILFTLGMIMLLMHSQVFLYAVLIHSIGLYLVPTIFGELSIYKVRKCVWQFVAGLFKRN